MPPRPNERGIHYTPESFKTDAEFIAFVQKKMDESYFRGHTYPKVGYKKDGRSVSAPAIGKPFCIE